MTQRNINKLKSLYLETSKHSNYQILPDCLSTMIKDSDLHINSRFEKERLKYICDNLSVGGKSILDVGGNTGYFTFSLIEKGAKFIHYFEGNVEHAKFVTLGSNILGLNRKIKVSNGFLSFDETNLKNNYDIVFLLNVLHHYGDDYGSNQITKEEAKTGIIEQINNISSFTKYLVVQIGFNWKGNSEYGLLEGGTKKEMIDFISFGTSEYWTIETVGIAEIETYDVVYKHLNNNNIKREDSIGEFLNRPIFILKSINL